MTDRYKEQTAFSDALLAVKCINCGRRADGLAMLGQPGPDCKWVPECEREACAQSHYTFTFDAIADAPDARVRHLQDSKRAGTAANFVDWIESVAGSALGLRRLLVRSPYGVKWPDKEFER